MSEPYCGIGDVPKGAKRGSMKECVEMGQVRYYGIKMIDFKLLDASKKSKNVMHDRKVLITKKIKLTAQIKKILDKIKSEKDKDIKGEMKEEVRSMLSSLKKVKEKLAAIDKEVNKIRNRESKKEIKKDSKQESKRKTSVMNENKKKKKMKKE